MADWNVPTLSSLYTQVLDYLKNRDVDAVTLCSSTPTNTPTGAMKWERAIKKFQEWSGAAWVDQILSIAGGGTGATDATTARTNLGLGTMATQNSNNVNITGGSVAGSTLSGSGAGLTNLPAEQLTGTVADARLTSNIPLKNQTNAFTAKQQISHASQATIDWYVTGAGVGAKFVRWMADATDFLLQKVDDAYTTATTLFRVDRNGNGFFTGYFTAVQPHCSAYHNTTQSVTINTWTALNLNSEDLDTTTMHDTVTNNSRITVPVAGTYLLTAKCSGQTTGTTYYQFRFRKNGTTYIGSAIMFIGVNTGTSDNTVGQLTALVQLNASDYIELMGRHTNQSGITDPKNFGSTLREWGTEVSVLKVS